MSRPIERVAVIGAGVMGSGIAQWISAHGIPVLLQDLTPEALAKGLKSAENIYRQGVERKIFTPVQARAGLDRISPLAQYQTEGPQPTGPQPTGPEPEAPERSRRGSRRTPLPQIDMVIEAASENLEIKRCLFAELEARTATDTLLATNTSALSIAAIAEGLAHPERVLGLHFFNPVHRMKLVEIIRGPRTGSEVIASALQFAQRLEKLPVVVQDSPGFLVNRILLPYLVEAIRLFSQGVSVEALDRLMLDFGMPMGPLRLTDEIGLDVAQDVAKDLERRLPRPAPVGETLEKMIARGWRGKKSGLGFYRFRGRKSARPNPALASLQTRGPASRQDAGTWRDRMVLIMVNEAARCLEEGVVASADDVDFGMLHGTGWAPERGGLLRHADRLGAAAVVARLETFANTVGPYFGPCELLVKMAAGNRQFHRT